MEDLAPVVGQRLGEFEVLEQIAEGGFGRVYRAHQPGLGRDAVIKVLSSSIDDLVRDRFTREAQLACRLDHPYAAHIYAFGAEPDGLQWIAMELVRGTSLSDLLKFQGKLPVSRFVPLFQAICQVVYVAHEQGIVHRDLKPSNVMVVSRAGVLLPKLLDFGIARLYSVEGVAEEIEQVDQRLEILIEAAVAIRSVETATTADGSRDTVQIDRFDQELQRLFGNRYAEITSTPRERSTELTSRAIFLGSPPYMAPELWLGPQAAGPLCDIYALGVLAFECLTGRLPFKGKKVLDFARSHMVDPLPDLGSTMPPQLHAVLAKAVAKRARDRYPDAMLLSRAVEDACRGDAPAFVSVARPPPALVATLLARAPQPIAELVASAEAATKADDAWVRYASLLALVSQYVGVLGLASWCRLGSPDGEVRGFVARLCDGDLDAAGWLALATEATRSFAAIRDAFPVPELVDVCHGDDPAIGPLRSLVELVASYGARSIDPLELAGLVHKVSAAIAGVVELFGYDLVVRTERGCEKWIGPRRRPRPLVEVSLDEPEGAPVLLDRNGAPVLSLWPLAKVIAPTPAADPELFLLAGSGRYGSRLVAQPSGFERQDAELAAWLAELAGGVVHGVGEGEEDRVPYRGLAAFSANDSAFFYGRERESEYLANHLRTRSFAAVVGPSGAGKSSFVQAGVAPLLPADWRTVVMRPGSRPFTALYDRMAALGLGLPPKLLPASLMRWLDQEARFRGATFVIVVDQAEELVTLCRDEAEREAFAELLASVRDDDRIRVVLTLRDDFLMRLQRLPSLAERLTNGIHLLGTPSRGDLRRILTEPAKRMGYEFEDAALVDEMVAAVVDNPSALALLSFTASKLWEQRDRQFRRLRRRVYTSLGGVGGALAQHAEDVIVHMSDDERELVREAFRHLVTADGTRAVIDQSELAELLGAGATHVIESLVQARLAVTGEASGGGVTVEVTHEALLGSWPRLVAWRRVDAESARLRDQLRASAKQWDARGRERGLLWRRDVLTEYRLWRARYKGRLTELEASFGAACIRDDARGIRRRRVLTSSAFVVLVAAAVVLYVFAARARASAAQATARTIDVMEEQGRRDLLDEHPLGAARPLARAYALGGRDSGLRLMLANAMAIVESQGPVLHGHDGFVRRSTFSADGTRVVTVADDKTIRLWDVATGAQLAQVAGVKLASTGDRAWLAAAAPGEVTVRASRDLTVVARWPLAPEVVPSAIAISDDAKRVVLGDRAGTIHVLDVDGARHATFALHHGAVLATVLGPSGEVWASSAEDGQVALGRGTAAPRLMIHGKLGVRALAIDAAGERLASGANDGTVKLWSVASGELDQVLAGHVKPIRSVAFTPDGKRLASASEDGTIRLWLVGSLLPPIALTGHAGTVFSVAFDRSGRQLVSAGADRTVRVWDVVSGAALSTLDAHDAEADFADFDLAGTHVVTAGFDQTARIWNLPHRDQRLAVEPTPGGFSSAAFDASGDRIVTAGVDGTARIYSVKGEEQLALPGNHGPLHTAAIAPDGARLATGSESGAAVLWSLESKVATATELEGAKGGIFSMRFRPDGSQLAIGGGDGIVRVFDPKTGALIRRLEGHQAAVWGLSYSADGKLVVTGSDDRTTRIWNADTGQPIRTIGPLAGQVNAAVFDPKAERIATGSDDGVLRIFRLRDGALLGELAAHHDAIASIAFSSDGERVATASMDHTVVVWDIRSLHALTRLQLHTEPVYAVAFQPGRERLLSTGTDGVIWLTSLPLEQRAPATIDRILDARH